MKGIRSHVWGFKNSSGFRKIGSVGEAGVEAGRMTKRLCEWVEWGMAVSWARTVNRYRE